MSLHSISRGRQEGAGDEVAEGFVAGGIQVVPVARAMDEAPAGDGLQGWA